MGSLLPLLVAALASGTDATADSASKADTQMEDLVVLGQADKSLAYEVLDEFGLNVRITARFRVARVIEGRLNPGTIKIRYIAHSDMPTDRELKLRLRRSEDGIYLVCSEGGGRGYICN